MTLFDTSALVAIVHEPHEEHDRAWLALEAHPQSVVSTHALAEVYSVLTGMKVAPRVSPTVAFRAVTSITESFEVINLDQADYLWCLQEADHRHVQGGGFYDLLHVRAADKAGASQILTFNVRHFERLVDDPRRVLRP